MGLRMGTSRLTAEPVTELDVELGAKHIVQIEAQLDGRDDRCRDR